MPDEAELEKLQGLIRKGGALERTEGLRSEYVTKAKKELEKVPDSPAVLRLEQLAGFLAEREY